MRRRRSSRRSVSSYSCSIPRLVVWLVSAAVAMAMAIAHWRCAEALAPNRPIIRLGNRPLGRPLRHIRRLSAAARDEAESSRHSNGPSSSNSNGNDNGGRYLALFDDYQEVRGPYFFALFDQLLELVVEEATDPPFRHVVVCTTRKDLELLENANSAIPDDSDEDEDNDTCSEDEPSSSDDAVSSWLKDLQSSLELDILPDLIVMDDWNPLRLEETRWSPSSSSSSLPPSQSNEDEDADSQRGDVHLAPAVVWLYGIFNAYHTRHLLRTSGFDRWIQERCASSSSSSSSSSNNNNNNNNKYNCAWIGEGAGAATAGVILAGLAKARGDDPRDAAVEWQPLGLGLVPDDEAESLVAAVLLREEDNTKEDNRNRDGGVYAWAQPPAGDATRFVLRPSQNGAMEDYRCDLDPLPPLVVIDDENTSCSNDEGVACWGEPSIDPSRAAQAGGIGDSEWWEE
eukprot:jgi/Psemu1/28840/gm1.28840_g